MSFREQLEEAFKPGQEAWIVIDRINAVKVEIVGPNPKFKHLTVVNTGGQEYSVPTKEIFKSYKDAKKIMIVQNENKGGSMAKMHEGVDILDETIDTKTLKALETLAGVNEEDIQILDNGFKFQFERSQVANKCMVVRYHDKLIIEFRKVTDNLLEGKIDQLVYENVIDPRQFSDIFESVTGIYLSYI